MLEPVYRAVSNTAVRKDMWVRLPPAAPIPAVLDIDCLASPSDVTLCADPRALNDAYVYLLGVYLGDGCLTEARRRVWRLRISMDRRYPCLIDRCEWAIEQVAWRSPGRIPRPGCYELYSSWKHWRCMFPQHGPGPKHRRRIELQAWQRILVDAYPVEMVRGLIHSDGCRFQNRVRRTWAGQTRQYAYPRYMFVNHSTEIRSLFMDACRAIGVESRPSNRYSISVARRDSVRILDDLVGPKR